LLWIPTAVGPVALDSHLESAGQPPSAVQRRKHVRPQHGRTLIRIHEKPVARCAVIDLHENPMQAPAQGERTVVAAALEERLRFRRGIRQRFGHLQRCLLLIRRNRHASDFFEYVELGAQGVELPLLLVDAPLVLLNLLNRLRVRDTGKRDPQHREQKCRALHDDSPQAAQAMKQARRNGQHPIAPTSSI
jgi:hypothetical protein